MKIHALGFTFVGEHPKGFNHLLGVHKTKDYQKVGFKCFGVFHTVFSKSVRIQDVKINFLKFTIYMRILNGQDHELGALKSA